MAKHVIEPYIIHKINTCKGLRPSWYMVEKLKNILISETNFITFIGNQSRQFKKRLETNTSSLFSVWFNYVRLCLVGFAYLAVARPMRSCPMSYSV